MHFENLLDKRNIFVLFICLTLAANSTAQEFSMSRILDIPIHVDGKELSYPFTGGMSMPRFNNIDLDNDGTQDLVVFESLGNKFLPFLQKKTNNGIEYLYRPEYESLFPDVRRYMIVLDFNQDGIKDIATSHDIKLGEGTLRFYKGLASNTGQILGYEEVVRRPLFPDLEGLLHMHPYDIPTVGDINNDGDADILLFPKNTTKIHYFENQSVEMGYGADSLIFDLYDDCWGSVEYSIADGLALESCPGFTGGSQSENRNTSCAGSYLVNYDIDRDGDKDVYFSNLFFKNLFILENGGTREEAHITNMNPDFLANLVDEMPFFPGSYLVDVDNDQDLDITVVTNNFGSVLTGSSREEFYLFSNKGDDINPVYELTNESFIVENTLDEGFRSSPTTIDYNGDGLLDLVISSNRDHPDYNYFSHLSLYQNNGTPETPSFVKVQENFANLREYLLKAAHPTFGDLDNDGDLDLVVGDNIGRLFYFENTSTGNLVYDFEPRYDFFDGIDAGNYARPQLIDLDRDGLLDLVSGSQFGKISFFKNTGSITDPAFEQVTDTLGQIYTRPGQIESNPYFFEAPDSSGYLMLNGLYRGNIELYKNIDGNLDGPFEKIESHLGDINVGSSATLHLADLNSDGISELIMGNERGGIDIYQMEASKVLSSSGYPEETATFKLYPNPALQQLYIEQPLSKEPSQLSLYSTSGVLLAEYILPANTQTVELNISALPQGLYFGTLKQGEQSLTQKILIRESNQ